MSKLPVIEDDVPEGVELYDPQDFGKRRQFIFSNALDGLKGSFPQSYGGVRMELADVDYADPDDFSLKQQREALLNDKFLSRRIRGRVKLFDDKTDELLDETDLTLMRVPYLTQRGTFIHGGNEYTSITQGRLTPGSYSRRQRNGELETQFNIRPGTGAAFRVALEPETSQYRLRVSQANLHLYSLLKDLGVGDEELVKTWGPEVLERNRAKYDARVFEKAFQRLVPAWQKRRLGDNLSRQQKQAAIQEALDGSLIDERVARINLPNMFDRAKAAAWREEGEAFEKEARKIDAQPFAPDLTPDQMSDEVNRLYNAGGARLASLPDWSDEWLHQSAPKGWIDWYTQYQQGARGDDDDRQIQRWKMFKARHGSQFRSNPTPRRAFALRNWAIDPLKMIPADQRETFSNTMNEYKRQMDENYQRSKAAGTLLSEPLLDYSPELVEHPSGLEFMNKVARFGAGVLFRQPNGKYLLEKNHPQDGFPEELVGKLRPAGGGKSKRDHTCRQTIIREIGEEFGLDADFVKDRIVLLGYQTKGKFRDCPIFEMRDHGLTPGRYQATNSDTEFVDLVEADLDDSEYIGPKLTSLRKYQRHYRPTPPKSWKPWYGVDLDGTLAQSIEPFDPKDIGDPVPAMVKKVKKWTAEGKTVKIFTARAAEKKSIPMIQAWCRMHDLPEMEVTNVKDPGMLELWDDRAIQVEKNKGTKRASATTEDAFHKGDWSTLGEFLNQTASAGINLDQSSQSIQEEILRFLELQHDVSPEILAAAETAREMAKSGGTYDLDLSEQAVVSSRFVTPYELEGYALSPEIGRSRTSAVDFQVFGPQSETDKLLS